MAGEEHPLIAVHGQLVADETPFLKLATAYTNALLRAGAIPVVVPAEAEPADLERLCARVDGIVLSGGDDFDTERLGLGPTHPAATPVPPEKQDLDMVLVRIAIERQIPVLGICYGMQLMALSEGGTLFQHLPEDRPGSQDHTGGRKHAIRVEGNTKLARALGVEQLDTISRASAQWTTKD
jgi:putative glutamine amidotransferase